MASRKKEGERMVGRSTEGDEADASGTTGEGLGEAVEVDPVTGVPLEDMMLTMAHLPSGVEGPDSGLEDFEDVPDADSQSRSVPVVAGLIKIDFNDDDAVQKMLKEVGDNYAAILEASGDKVAPDGSLRIISEGGVPVKGLKKR
jgi:hypothetical protein